METAGERKRLRHSVAEPIVSLGTVEAAHGDKRGNGGEENNVDVHVRKAVQLLSEEPSLLQRLREDDFKEESVKSSILHVQQLLAESEMAATPPQSIFDPVKKYKPFVRKKDRPLVAEPSSPPSGP
eukprot:6177850-Pleurochrysis_carterae.AAC.1